MPPSENGLPVNALRVDRLVRRVSVGVLFGATLVAMGCSQPTGPIGEELQEGTTRRIDFAMTPEIVRLDGSGTTSLESFNWSSTATVRGGRLQFDPKRSGGSGPMTSDDPFVVDDATFLAMVPLLGFTTGANGAYVAPINPADMYDSTATYVDSAAVTLTVASDYGTWGNRLRVRIRKNGVLVTTARFTWVTAGTGVTLSRIILEDFQQPGVLIRTNISVTSANVVVLSGLENFFEPVWQKATAVSSRLAAAAVELCLPQPAYASTSMMIGCHTKAAGKIIFSLFGAFGAGTGLVVAVNSGNWWAIRGAVSAMIAATGNALIGAYEYDACPK